METIPVPIDTATEFVSQLGAVLVALIGAASGAAVAWFHGRKTGQQEAPAPTAAQEEADRLHEHMTSGFKAQMDAATRHYESLLAKYDALHEARSQRIEELTREVHELRAEVHLLQQTLAEHGIPIPARNKVGGSAAFSLGT